MGDSTSVTSAVTWDHLNGTSASPSMELRSATRESVRWVLATPLEVIEPLVGFVQCDEASF